MVDISQGVVVDDRTLTNSGHRKYSECSVRASKCKETGENAFARQYFVAAP